MTGRLSAAAARLPADAPGHAAPFLRGLALLQAADLEGAAKAFRESRRLSPEFVDATVFLGVCFPRGCLGGRWRLRVVRRREGRVG
jgi:hypothetical protein